MGRIPKTASKRLGACGGKGGRMTDPKADSLGSGGRTSINRLASSARTGERLKKRKRVFDNSPVHIAPFSPESPLESPAEIVSQGSVDKAVEEEKAMTPKLPGSQEVDGARRLEACVDGGWVKRVVGSSLYNSLAGIIPLIGNMTGKICDWICFIQTCNKCTFGSGSHRCGKFPADCWGSSTLLWGPRLGARHSQLCESFMKSMSKYCPKHVDFARSLRYYYGAVLCVLFWNKGYHEGITDLFAEPINYIV